MSTTSADQSDADRGRVPTVIRTPDQRLRVFVSSTLQELAAERAVIREAIERLRLTPVMFELGARPHPPRDLYRAYVAQSDVFVGIYWERYGWVAPGEQVSGLEDEYRLAGERPKLIYVKSPAPGREPRLQELLGRIKADDTASYKPFHEPEELRELLENDLAVLLTESFTQQQSTLVQEEGAQPHDDLPRPRSPLIDRQDEVAAACALLGRQDVGLVTLTGAGGSGKTRLALEVAARLREMFADGVRFVSLAPLTDPELVYSAILERLGLREAGEVPLQEILITCLQSKHLLLVLDNFEHLLPAAPLVNQLLDHCPQLKVLATSRTPLRLRGEKELPVPPLALPDLQALPDRARLAQYAAIALFVQRAQNVKPDFVLTAEIAPVVAEICQRLDGLPLAIELAAARIKLLPPRALLARLNHRLPLLTGGARDLPERQQTLRNAIAWSYDLLSDEEKRLFGRLAVFAGGCTLEAAEAVADVGGDQLLVGVESLLDRGLLWTREGMGGEPRLGMLATIREYAQERLLESGEEAALRRRHAEVFLGLAEQAEPYLTSAERDAWVKRLVADQDNLRDALGWCLTERHDAEMGARLAGALAWFWYLRGQLSEGRWWLDRAHSETRARVPPADRAKVLFGEGALTFVQRDLASASSRLKESVAIYRAVGDRAAQARALTFLAAAMVSEGDLGAALPLYHESLGLLRAAGDRWWEAFTLHFLADATRRTGDPVTARSLYQEGLAIYEALGDRWGRALLLTYLGQLAAEQGDAIAASSYYDESAACFRAMGDKHLLALTLVAAAMAAGQRADHEQAKKLWIEALGLWRDLGNRTYTVLSLVGLAQVAEAQGEQERAARLFGAAEAQVRAVGAKQVKALETIYPALYRTITQESMPAGRSQRDNPAYRAAWADGGTMTPEQAVAYALEEDLTAKPGWGWSEPTLVGPVGASIGVK